MTEAYRSTANEAFRQAALDSAEDNDFLKKTPSARKFIAYLKGDGEEFPGLEYWY